MDEYQFNKAELADFKRFWQSDIGEKYIEKMKRSKEDLLDRAMATPEKDVSTFFAHAANGVDSVIQDIDALIKGMEDGKKKKTK